MQLKRIYSIALYIKGHEFVIILDCVVHTCISLFIMYRAISVNVVGFLSLKLNAKNPKGTMGSCNLAVVLRLSVARGRRENSINICPRDLFYEGVGHSLVG